MNILFKPKIVKSFSYKNRRCIVTLIDFGSSLFPKYHNGYIEIRKSENKFLKNCYSIAGQEITYIGNLEHIESPSGKTFIGFDTAHYFNLLTPETQTFKHVEKICREIVDRLSIYGGQNIK